MLLVLFPVWKTDHDGRFIRFLGSELAVQVERPHLYVVHKGSGGKVSTEGVECEVDDGEGTLITLGPTDFGLEIESVRRGTKMVTVDLTLDWRLGGALVWLVIALTGVGVRVLRER